jgi:AGCS family alanine or glycine:cation symporter
MVVTLNFQAIIDYLLFVSCLFLLIGSVYISFKTKFVQLRLLPELIKKLSHSINRKDQDCKNTVLPHKALFTAMSTTLGIGTIVGPIIAIYLGGPGALLGFLLMSLLGSAATFTEVSLAVKFRNKCQQSGLIIGGPMEYLKHLLSPKMAKWYAISCCILMTAWSAAQANQLAAILNSPLLGNYGVQPAISGVIVAVLVLFTLFGGIKRISTLSSKMVPLMFVLFLGSSCWILMANAQKLPSIFTLIFSSAFSPTAMASGTVVGGLISALRWGILKGTQSTEAGIGTQTIPHSMTRSEDATAQGTLAMISTYTSGLVAFISGCVVLVTDTWQNPELPIGISMIAASFHMYFADFGVIIIAICTFLFAFGTILGNSYNGSQCFVYLADSKRVQYYFAFSAFAIFLGSISEVKTVWSVIDIFLVGMAIPHMFALMSYVRKNKLEQAIELS